MGDVNITYLEVNANVLTQKRDDSICMIGPGMIAINTVRIRSTRWGIREIDLIVASQDASSGEETHAFREKDLAIAVNCHRP